MYKVLLVDDEPWALSGIRNTFQWEKFGFEVIAETTVPAEAFDIIINQRPDVVFTDVRMPEMSGLELMEKVRERGLDTEFVVVSGFGEFSYAQQAIRQGAFDYCLKPLEFDYADKLLDKLYKYLEDKKSDKKLMLFESIIESKTDQVHLAEMGLSINRKYYQSAVVILKDTAHPDRGAMLFPSELSRIEIKLGNNKTFYLFNVDQDIQNLVDRSGIKNACVGISSLNELPDKIERLYYEADIAACNYFIYNECKVYKYAKKNSARINPLIKNLCDLIEKRENDKLEKLIDDIPVYFKVNSLCLEDLVYLWNQLVAYVSKNSESNDINEEFDFTDYRQLISQHADINSFVDFLKREVSEITDISFSDKEDNGSVFTKILSYIHEHYSEQIYLRDIARMFHVNPNYCCRLFKKHTSKTFSEYINTFRIEKAMKLLRTTELTMEEIAEKVGYNDYFYFIKSFKRNQGVSPGKFRKVYKSDTETR